MVKVFAIIAIIFLLSGLFELTRFKKEFQKLDGGQGIPNRLKAKWLKRLSLMLCYSVIAGILGVTAIILQY